MSGVSDSVLEALARALQLDEAERAHLFDLARALRPMSSPRRRRAPTQRVRPSVQHVLDGLTGAAAFVHNARLGQPGPPTTSATPSTPTCSAGPQAPVLSTAPVTSSPTPAPATSTSTGTTPPATSSPCCDQHRPRPLRPRPLRPRRRVLHPERRIPHPLGRPQRPLPRHRHQGTPPPRRRRHHPHLQPHGTRRRPRADAHDLDRRTRIQIRRGAQPPRKLGRDASTNRATRRPGPSLKLAEHRWTIRLRDLRGMTEDSDSVPGNRTWRFAALYVTGSGSGFACGMSA